MIAGCSRSETTTRAINLHAPAACAVPDGSYARYLARGDFQPSAAMPAEDDVVVSASALLQNLPVASRSLLVDVLAIDDSRWVGMGLIPDTGNVDVLLWPASQTCGLTTTIPGAVDPAIGFADSRHAIVSGGRSTSVSVIPSSWIVDLGTGEVTEMPNGPLTVRERATITPIANGALLAGGVHSDDPNGFDNTAEIWLSSSSDFEGQRIPLSFQRAEHGAVQLASGDVLLVGGIGSSGKPLGTMEIVSLKQRRGLPGGLPVLVPRTQPTVLRLATGEILVAGGKDENGKPVGLLEILSPDAKALRQTLPFPARTLDAFAALDAGGALLISVPDAGDPPTFANVWRLTSEHALLPLPIFPEIDKTAADVRVFGASGGGAIVWSGSQWYAWEPWTETFTRLPTSPGPKAGTPTTLPEQGMPIWLATDSGALRVTGRRFSIRNQFSTEVLPLASLDRGPLAPDRSPNIAGMTFDPGAGLFLPKDTAVFVADGRYGDFVLDATLGDAPPVVVLRDVSGATYELGGGDCPLAVGSGSGSLHVERVGAAIGSGTAGAMNVCAKPIPFGRVAIGFRGNESTLQNIRLRRTVN